MGLDSNGKLWLKQTSAVFIRKRGAFILFKQAVSKTVRLAILDFLNTSTLLEKVRTFLLSGIVFGVSVEWNIKRREEH